MTGAPCSSSKGEESSVANMGGCQSFSRVPQGRHGAWQLRQASNEVGWGVKGASPKPLRLIHWMQPPRLLFHDLLKNREIDATV